MFNSNLKNYFFPLLHKFLPTINNQKGVSAVIIAITSAMLLGFVALAVDVGYMYVTRNELQNVADAAALASCGELGRIYLGMDPALQNVYQVSDSDRDDRIYPAATDVAETNIVAGESITIDTANDITIGQWDWEDEEIDPTLDQPDAVRVIARRGAVATFFAKILSIFGGNSDTFNVVAVATAALSGPSTVTEGELNTPFAISSNFAFECDDVIAFSPADSCAGWHKFDQPGNASANDMKALCYDLIMGDEVGDEVGDGEYWLQQHFNEFYVSNQTPSPYESPAIDVDDDDEPFFNFNGGTLASLLGGSYYLSWTNKDNPDGSLLGSPTAVPDPFRTLFDYYRFRDGGPDDAVWETAVPVYLEDPDSAENECEANPTGEIQIVGFSWIRIIMPNGPPDNTITVEIDCSTTVIAGGGGGGTFGTILGSIPNLVQ